MGDWKKKQETTFTKWVNSRLKGHLTSNKNRVTDLSTDLQDGIILAELLEQVAKAKLKYVKEGRHLKFKPQKLENLGVSFKFMDAEKIYLVNIGPEDIFNGNLKLIMGLIWTLIRRFQIRSTGKALSTKEAMLAWVNTQIPDFNIKNFTTDWNNGIALCALIEKTSPGLISNYASLSHSEGLMNCKLGMGVAEDKLGIPEILDPEDLNHPDVDEISVMTYISYFCTPANAHLLKWVQATIPHRNITNFTTDWNNGINLGHLLEALNPGGFPECKELDPKNALDNLTRSMKAADDQLGIKPVLKPSEMADPSVDELNVVTYLSRFQNAKPLPQPHAISCSGEGLRKAVVSKEATFEIDTSKGGSGDLGVVIDCEGKPVKAEITPNFGAKNVYTVKYIPVSAGKLSIVISWSGTEIPSSPYSVSVVDPGSVTLSGPQIAGDSYVKVGELVKFEAKGVADVADLEVKVEFSSGHSEPVKLTSSPKGTIECTYTARVVGVDKISATVSGLAVPGSPFKVHVVDPSVLSMALKEPAAGESLLIGGKAAIVVTASKGGVEGAEAEVSWPSGTEKIPLKASTDKKSSMGFFAPKFVGKHEIRVTCAGEQIGGSPVSFQVSDPSKCSLTEDLPSTLHVGEPHTTTLSVKGAGEGSAEAKSSDTGILSLDCKQAGGEQYGIKLDPKSVGNVTVSINWNGKPIAKMPHKIAVCDATKCSASGPGLTSGKGKIQEPFEFKVQVTGAGNGELKVSVKGPKSSHPADITKNPDGSYKVVFTTQETGDHSIQILWSGRDIPNSPYIVNFYKPAEAGSFTATGDGLKTAVALSTAQFLVIGHESGLIDSGLLKFSITGNNLKSVMSTKSAFKPTSKKIPILATDNGKGSYGVEYVVPTAGKYSIAVNCDGDHISGSPFQVEVLPAPDASKCRAFGHAIDNPAALIVEKPVEFKVDVTDAGMGELKIVAQDPNGSTVPAFLAEDKTDPARKCHSVKIDPKLQGKHKVSVKWSDKDIPKSPFTFDVSDPKQVTILDLADAEDYVGRKGEPITFSVDTRKAGPGELKAAAKLDDGKVELFTQKPNKDKTIKLSYMPAKEGRLELLLTFGGANILPSPWAIDIADLSTFKVLTPKEAGRIGEPYKFVINGMSKKQAKNAVITAKNNGHDATVKLEFGEKGQSGAHFTPKEVGQYTVEVKVAKKHVPGSPFQCSVVNPESCVVEGSIPSIIPIGVEKSFSVDTSKAGPGDLTCQSVSDEPSHIILTTISSGKKKEVKMLGKECGKSPFSFDFGGYPIPSMPVDVTVTDPSQCSFSCKQIDDGYCKTTDELTISINTTKGASCQPEVVIEGPKSKYDIKLKKMHEGEYTVALTPWQDGPNTLRVMAGGVDIAGSPKKFESLKPLDTSKVTVGGPALEKGAITNRRAEMIIYARESMLVDRGILSVAFKDGEKRDLEVYDQQNGTYTVSFTAMDVGSLELSVAGEGKEIAGSPFNINVLPEPDPSKCMVQDRSGERIFLDSSMVYHKVRTPFELQIITTDAGTGVLEATGKAPNGSMVRVFKTDDKVNGEKISYVKFDPTQVGVYTLSITWDKQELSGSPYRIMVVDPSKCILDSAFPSSVKIGEELTFEINTSSAGEGEIELISKGPEAQVSVAKKEAGVFLASLTGVQLGSTTVDMRYGGFSLPTSPYAVSVCDPSKCAADFSQGTYNLNTPFKFSVSAKEAGRAKLQVLPSKKGTAVMRNVEDTSTWEVSFTPKEIGTYSLRVLWGEWEIKGSPFTFTVCDPGSVKIEGIPDPNEFLLIGEPVSFTLDRSEAGSGELVCYTLVDSEKKDIGWEETDGEPADLMSLQFVPEKPGKIQLVVKFNGMDLLLRPHIYDVPDPFQFKVTPPKGFGKIKEYVKFNITGIKEDTELKITATHPNHDATVKMENSDNNTIIARMTPKEIGDYAVEVKHAGQHIDGSPFTIQVCDPDACRFVGDPPSVVHVGVEPNIQVDPSEAGPGELTFESEVIAGVEDATTREEGETKWTLSLKEGVGKIRVMAKWGGYNIPGSPFIMTIVDSQRVTWSCEALDEKNYVRQGELIKIVVDGTEAGEVVPEVVAKGPEEEYPSKIADNEDGTYSAVVNPWQVGTNEVSILWGGQPIPDMPISFEVLKGIDASTMTVSGSGLQSAVAETEASVTINAHESGLLERGLLEVAFESKEEGEGEEEDSKPSCDVTDNGDGTYQVLFTAPKAGLYTLSIKFEGQHITDSPFNIKVKGAADPSSCKAFGEAIERTPAVFAANDPVKFSVDTSNAGSGTLAISATQPDRSPIQVYTIVEGDVHHLKFDPEAIGHYKMEVLWDGTDIPGSPFDFNVVDPSKCVVKGLPSGSAHVPSGEPVKFSVETSEAGECSPQVELVVKGEATMLEPVESTEGTFNYSFTPQGFWKFSISVTAAGIHVPKSPFTLTEVDPNTFSIIGTNLKGDYAIVCEPVVFEIVKQAKEEEEEEEEELTVTAHGPSADLTVSVVQMSEGQYSATFVPIEPGSYEVFVEYGGKHVKGSPSSIKVADPSKCQLLGGAVTSLQVGQMDEMTIKTRGAGEGVLKVLTKYEDESFPTLEAEVDDLGLDTYSVKLTGKEIGKASIDIQWAGYTISGSPFLVTVCDASKCKAYGDVLTSQKGKAGNVIKFMVETAEAGLGELEVAAKGPSASYTVNVEEVSESTYEASFTPWEIGDHKIKVLWSKGDVPGSPFSVNVGNPREMEVCNATGDGLKHAIAGHKATFTILCSEVGLLDKNVLKVSVMGVTAHAEAKILDNNNGCYTVDYIPPSPGAYVASVLFHDRHIPGSPFKITVDPGPDASKCKAYGPALHPNALAIAGSPLEFFVDTSAAGYGNLKVYIQGPEDYKPKVFTANDEKGIYSIKFDAMKAGKYFAVVVWSDKHIPNSPFRLRVNPAADASKVKAYGPGLLDGFIGTPGQFTIETKNAGIGTLLIRVHGLKDSFKIEAKPLSEDDTRTLIVTYSPKLVGEYTVFVRWSGVHVPGSPFTVNIKQKPGAFDPSAEPVKSPQRKQPITPATKTPEKKAQKQDVQKKRSTSKDKRQSQASAQKRISTGSRPSIKKSPSGDVMAVSNPVAPGMKLHDNPAMAKSLAQSLPPGQQQIQGGYVAPTQTTEHFMQQQRMVQKKVVKKRVVRKRSSSRGMSREGRSAVPGRAKSPEARGHGNVTSPSRRGRAMSPGTKESRDAAARQKPTSPARKPASPVSSPEHQATSPTRKISTSSEGHSRRVHSTSPPPPQAAISPSRKAASPGRKAASPGKKAASPGRKATSPPPKGAKKKKVVKKGTRPPQKKLPPKKKP